MFFLLLKSNMWQGVVKAKIENVESVEYGTCDIVAARIVVRVVGAQASAKQIRRSWGTEEA